MLSIMQQTEGTGERSWKFLHFLCKKGPDFVCYFL